MTFTSTIVNYNNTLSDPYEIACRFSAFFLNVGTTLANKTSNTAVNLLHYIKNHFSPMVCFVPPAMEEVGNIILLLKILSQDVMDLALP